MCFGARQNGQAFEAAGRAHSVGGGCATQTVGLLEATSGHEVSVEDGRAWVTGISEAAACNDGACSATEQYA